VGLAQLITGSGGYAATVGGTVRVIGSNDVDVISLADIAGKISFDGSFNRGGDFIVLPNAAKTYAVVRASSSITLSDADSSITIPVGSKGTTLQFSDGELVLKFDGQIMIGSQIVTTASAAITTTPSSKTALPAATSASGTLLMAADEPVTVGGNVRVVGTNGADTVTVADVAGNISFDGSFNRGGDKIVVGKFAENYSAARPNASNVTIGDSDTKLTIPLGSKGSSIQFSNESRTLVYSEGNAYLGNQKLSASGASVNSFAKNTVFEIQPNAFPSEITDFRKEWSINNPEFAKYLTGIGAQTPIFADINRDGFEDVIIQFTAGIYQKDIGPLDRPVQIKIFINEKGNYLVDKTFDLLGNSNWIESVSASSVVFDVNSDGIPDFIFSPNKVEGGAIVSNPAFDSTDYFSKIVAFISFGDKYEKVLFGKPRFWGYISSINVEGETYVVGSSDLPVFDVQYAYKFENGEFKEYELGLPLLTRAFQIINGKDNNANYIVQQSQYGNLKLDLFEYNGQNKWQFVNNTQDLFSSLGKIKVNNASGSSFDSQVYLAGGFDDFMDIKPHYSMNGIKIFYDMPKTGDGYYIVTPSYIRGAIYRENNDADAISLFQLEMQIIPGYEPGVTKEAFADRTLENSLINVNKLYAYKIENGILIPVKLTIKGEISTYANDISVKDVNFDGINDIIIHHFENGMPVIYLGKGGLNFERMEINAIFDGSYIADGSSGWMFDFDNDGDFDILSIPTLGQNNEYTSESVNIFVSSGNLFG
jgi:hypothetical protein